MTLKHIIGGTAAMALLMGCNAKTETPIDSPVIETVSIKEEPITSGALGGLYRNAGEQSPVILIVPGSGPTDLNGNSAMGMTSNALKYLAEDLSKAGISSVRVDKRGMFSSAAAGNPNEVTVDIYAKDYQDWIDTVREKTKARCIYLLGHSEGATMVSAAAIDRTDVCGLILVAGAGRPLGAILREQLKSTPANLPILKDALATLEILEGGERADVADLHPALQGLFAPAIQDYYISTLKLDPAQLAKQAAVKTLILQGNHDIQITLEDAEKLTAATQGELVVLDGVNHILKQSPANRMGNIATYNNPDLPISPLVVDAIFEFTKG